MRSRNRIRRLLASVNFPLETETSVCVEIKLKGFLAIHNIEGFIGNLFAYQENTVLLSVGALGGSNIVPSYLYAEFEQLLKFTTSFICISSSRPDSESLSSISHIDRLASGISVLESI